MKVVHQMKSREAVREQFIRDRELEGRPRH